MATALADKARAVTRMAAAVEEAKTAADRAAADRAAADRAAADRAAYRSAYRMKAAFIFRCRQWRRTRPRRFRTASHRRSRASLFEAKMKAKWIAKWENKLDPLRKFLNGLVYCLENFIQGMLFLSLYIQGYIYLRCFIYLFAAGAKAKAGKAKGASVFSSDGNVFVNEAVLPPYSGGPSLVDAKPPVATLAVSEATPLISFGPIKRGAHLWL